MCETCAVTSLSTRTLPPEDEMHEQIMLTSVSSKAANEGEASSWARRTDYAVAGELTRRSHALRRHAAAIPRVICPECGGKMRLAYLEPHPVPDVRKETTTFFCDCGEKYSYTIAPRT